MAHDSYTMLILCSVLLWSILIWPFRIASLMLLHWMNIMQQLGKYRHHDQHLVRSLGDQNTSAWQISDQSFLTITLWRIPETTNLTSQIWRVLVAQNWANFRKVKRTCPTHNQFWRDAEYISLHHFRPFFPCVLQRMISQLLGQSVT